MKTSETKPCSCPACGYRIDRATGIRGSFSPKQGDFSICFKCAELLVFNQDLTIRLATEAEINDLAGKQPKDWALIQKARGIITKKLNAQRRKR